MTHNSNRANAVVAPLCLLQFIEEHEEGEETKMININILQELKRTTKFLDRRIAIMIPL